jgi:hypothetical protein
MYTNRKNQWDKQKIVLVRARGFLAFPDPNQLSEYCTYNHCRHKQNHKLCLSSHHALCEPINYVQYRYTDQKACARELKIKNVDIVLSDPIAKRMVHSGLVAKDVNKGFTDRLDVLFSHLVQV